MLTLARDTHSVLMQLRAMPSLTGCRCSQIGFCHTHMCSWTISAAKVQADIVLRVMVLGSSCSQRNVAQDPYPVNSKMESSVPAILCMRLIANAMVNSSDHAAGLCSACSQSCERRSYLMFIKELSQLCICLGWLSMIKLHTTHGVEKL